MNYAANDKVSFMVGLVNGWNNVQENNSGKTFMASVTLKPSGEFSIIENYIGGPETADNATTRNLSDTVLTYTASPKFALMGNFDFGSDGGAGLVGRRPLREILAARRLPSRRAGST